MDLVWPKSKACGGEIIELGKRKWRNKDTRNAEFLWSNTTTKRKKIIKMKWRKTRLGWLWVMEMSCHCTPHGSFTLDGNLAWDKIMERYMRWDKILSILNLGDGKWSANWAASYICSYVFVFLFSFFWVYMCLFLLLFIS